jgi:hypothetical protein
MGNWLLPLGELENILSRTSLIVYSDDVKKNKQTPYFLLSAIMEAISDCGAEILTFLDVFCPAFLTANPMTMAKYLKYTKVMDVQSKSEMLVVANKEPAAINGPNSFTFTLTELLKDSVTDKDWLSAEYIKTKLVGLSKRNKFEVEPRWVKNMPTESIALEPSYS